MLSSKSVWIVPARPCCGWVSWSAIETPSTWRVWAVLVYYYLKMLLEWAFLGVVGDKWVHQELDDDENTSVKIYLRCGINACPWGIWILQLLESIELVEEVVQEHPRQIILEVCHDLFQLLAYQSEHIFAIVVACSLHILMMLLHQYRQVLDACANPHDTAEPVGVHDESSIKLKVLFPQFIKGIAKNLIATLGLHE